VTIGHKAAAKHLLLPPLLPWGSLGFSNPQFANFLRRILNRLVPIISDASLGQLAPLYCTMGLYIGIFAVYCKDRFTPGAARCLTL